MTPTHDPTPDLEVDRPDPGRSHMARLLLAAVVAIGVLLLGWFLFVYAEPVPEGPGVDEIEQEEDDAIDSTDG